ncbi:MAG TPA: PilZ domain-containing protein, partial [Minicystis sp.]|nr:PilZ domain-containing protein [Minicystis sp.]
MGAWLGRRSKPRVEFNEAVRVIWPGEVSGVVARAVNLSLAGIRVDAPTPAPCAVGTDVLCDVTLPRGPRLLRGRVAHRRLLSSAKVGMGIEFVDLSARELAELRAVVGDAAEGLGPHPQRVKVRFEGTNQVVRARAFPTESGFRLATSLPFLKTETEVEIALPSDAGASVRGWVSAVALERSGAEESPRLFIDVRVDDGDQWVDRTAITDPTADDVTPIEAVPAHVWDEDEVAATTEVRAAAPSVPTIVASSPALPPIVGGPGSAPHLRGDDADLTEIVALPPPRSSRWRALAGGMIAGAVALAAFVAALVVMR